MRDFLNIICDYLCCRCGRGSILSMKDHNGKINKYFVPKNKINFDFYENYFNNVNEGLFHSLSRCYLYYIIYKGICEKKMAIILLQDFLKCNKIECKDWETLLNNFPNCDTSSINNYNIILDTNDPYKKKEIKIYNDTIKPILKYFYKNRNEIFIRHGIENREEKSKL